MTLEIKYACDNPAEFVELLRLVAQNNLPAASAFETEAYTNKAAEPSDMVAQEQPAEDMPWVESTVVDVPKDEPTPAITLDDLKALGRKIAAAGKGAFLRQAINDLGAKSMSTVPEGQYAALYKALSAELEA